MDEELICWCVLATRAACVRMTARHLKALQDSVGQACLPACQVRLGPPGLRPRADRQPAGGRDRRAPGPGHGAHAGSRDPV